MFFLLEGYVMRNTNQKKFYFAIEYKKIYCYNFLYSVLKRRKR